MAFTFDIWNDDCTRQQIKRVFGNRHNWLRFCDIAQRLRFEVWKHSI